MISKEEEKELEKMIKKVSLVFNTDGTIDIIKGRKKYHYEIGSDIEYLKYIRKEVERCR